MAHQGGVDRPQAVHALVEGIGEHGGAPGQALLQNQVFFPQLLLQQAGPALGFIKPAASRDGIGGVGAIAMGIGIAETDNVFFHNRLLSVRNYGYLSQEHPQIVIWRVG